MAAERRTDTETVEMDIGESRPSGQSPHAAAPEKVPVKAAGSPSRTLPTAGGAPAGQTYRPASALLDSVTVTDWNTDYAYYEKFREAALRLWEYTAEACPPLPFFSYIPQYSQMSREQLSYYLYLRQEICEGRYPEADYSYLLLLLYETINLSDINSTEYSLSVFCRVFAGYRETFERLGMQVADWMCDFCLIHGCVPPRAETEPFLGELAAASGFPEFYVGLYSEKMQPATVVRYSSQYDYTKSRFARENAALYEKTMQGLLSRLMTDAKLAADFDNAMSERYTVTRDAYVGALCAPRIKKRMTVTFRSFSRSHGIRFLVSDILRYADNRLRGYLGYKSRISVGKLPPEIKAAADAYFSEALGLRKSPGAPEVPAYEKLYEPAPSRLTAEAAAQIERESWDTTEKLVEAFAPAGEDTAAPPETAVREAAPVAAMAVPEEIKPDVLDNTAAPAEEPEESGEGASSFSPAEKEFLFAALREDGAAQKKIAAAAGKNRDILADAINEKAADLFGDILLEDTGAGYRVLEDYLDTVKKELGL